MPSEVIVFWFRRDLRIHDNHGLYQALRSGTPVLPLFIFDTNILDNLEDKFDPRLDFIHQYVSNLDQEFRKVGSTLRVEVGDPLQVFKKIFQDFTVKAIFTNEDYEPYAIHRDKIISDFAQTNASSFQSFKDHVIFEKREILTDGLKPYTVFTPYKRKWIQKLQNQVIPAYSSMGTYS